MKKVTSLIVLIFLLLTTGSMCVCAEEHLPPKLQKLTDEALEEPGIIPMNQITAWSYKCLARYNQGDSLGFEEAYKEHAQLIAEHGGQFMEMESNAPIGLWPELDFEGQEVNDMHGKTLFVYTDGINEAENANKEQFGDARLQALLQQDLGDARQTSETIHKAVEAFVGDAEPSDDLTKICIKLK